MNFDAISQSLEILLEQYQQSFTNKAFMEETSEEDDLMMVFGLTQDIKAENRQYWGRELGLCWQRLVTEICRQTCPDFRSPIREARDELCDLIIGRDAIDTKYRLGSGDSGTLKKFKNYAIKLRDMGFNPVLLILRRDSLPQAIAACLVGGWEVKVGDESYQYLYNLTQFDLKTWLQQRRNGFRVNRILIEDAPDLASEE